MGTDWEGSGQRQCRATFDGAPWVLLSRTGSPLLNRVLPSRLKDEHWAFLERAFCPGLEPGSP